MPATNPTAPIVAHTHQATARRENGAAGDDGLLSDVAGGAWFIWVVGAVVVGAAVVGAAVVGAAVVGAAVVGAAVVGAGVKYIPSIVTQSIPLVGMAGGVEPMVGTHSPKSEIWSAPLQQLSCDVETQTEVYLFGLSCAGLIS